MTDVFMKGQFGHRRLEDGERTTTGRKTEQRLGDVSASQAVRPAPELGGSGRTSLPWSLQRECGPVTADGGLRASEWGEHSSWVFLPCP